MEAIGDMISFIISAPFICCGWLIVGFIAGALARGLMKAPNRPFISDIILGILGAIVGGFVTSLFSIDTTTSAGLANVLITIVVATGGAMLLIFLSRLVSR